MKLRALIVDDELLARQRLRLLIDDEPRIELVAECAGGLEAIPLIEQDRPDLLFLDIQMPEIDGFEVLQRLKTEAIPMTIFTTAYDQHALRAFDAHALDYLLKPIGAQRFKQAIDRAHHRLTVDKTSLAAEGILDLLATQRDGKTEARNEVRYLRRLTVRTDDRVLVLNAGEIEYIESAGNYVAIHVGSACHLLRDTLNHLEAQLDPSSFLRISRSVLVNLNYVRELQPMFKGETVVVLEGGTTLGVTRGAKEIETALRYS